MCENEHIIDHIMDSFNFDRVHAFMVLDNWRWSTCDGVPSVAKLRQCARRLLNDVVSGKYIELSTGGFNVRNGGEIIVLSFILDSSSYWVGND